MSKRTLLSSAGVASLAFSAFVLISPQLACGDKDDDGGTGTMTGTDGGTTDGGATTDGGTTDGGATTDGGTTDGGTTGDGGTESISGTVSGTVRVQLFTASEIDNEREFIAWEDTVFGDEFPFGSILVTATQENDAGGLNYRGNTTILSPTIAGDDYSLNVSVPAEGDVQVYATLDVYGDGIISTSEPIGIYPGNIEIVDGEEQGEKDILVLVDYDAAYDYWYGGGGGGGGSCDNPVVLSGTATLTSSWAGGDVAVLLYDEGNNGPYYYDRETPTSSGGGAEAPFSMQVCGPLGNMNMLGAWDSNGNGLIDPADLWGGYISKPDVEANPLAISKTDISDIEVQIPLGDGASDLGVVPFVNISGNVMYDGGSSFDKLATDSVVYMTALLYRPDGDISVDDVSALAYDSETWEPADYAGQTLLDYTLWVPGNSIVYVWAYVDEGPKPNGVVNEMGELVGSGGGNSSGSYPTGSGTTGTVDIDLGHGG